MVAKNDSATALSQHCPRRPTESRMPWAAARRACWSLVYCPPVAVMDQLAVTHVTRPDAVLERGQDQVGVAAVGGLPADDPAGEHIADRSQPEHPLTTRDAGGVGDP
jgi:hypothetical protein